MKIKIERGKSINGYYAVIKALGGVNFMPFIIPSKTSVSVGIDIESIDIDDIHTMTPLEVDRTRSSDGSFIYYDEIRLNGESVVELQKVVDIIVDRVKIHFENFVKYINYRNYCNKLWKSEDDEVIELD